MDENGDAHLSHRAFPALRVRAPYRDEEDKGIMLEMQRRFELDKYGEDD